MELSSDSLRLAAELDALRVENRRLTDELEEVHILYQNTIEHGEAVENQLADTNIELAAEKKKADDLLLNILPAETADELKRFGRSQARSFDPVTVMFTDFKGFTQISERLSPQALVAELDECFRAFDEIVGRYPIEKIKTIGDSYLCVGGLPTVNSSHACDLVAAGLDIQRYMLSHKLAKQEKGELFFEIRIGIHTGPVVAGIVGVKKFAYDIWGDTVNTASRMESSCEVGKINISGATWALVKERFDCVHRGKIAAKNKGDIDMYFVDGETVKTPVRAPKKPRAPRAVSKRKPK
ncbi:MAG: hypothetical protein JWL59_1293 [Chthoniobacteraceae bacterium]|nr:hypothetical protein [Chthoniobacteraceae bacterium]